MSANDEGIVLTVSDMDEKYRDEWLLVADCELGEKAELKAGRVVEHSRSREDVRRKLKDYPGHVAIRFTGKIPDDLVVVF